MATRLMARPLTILDAIYGRRSVRSYTSTPLDRETIRALLDAAVQAPTAMHNEPWQFVVLQDRGVLERLSDRVKRSLQHPPPPAGPARAPADGASLHAAFAAGLATPAFNVFYGAPAVIVIGTTDPGPFVEADCWLAADNLMLAAWGLGLGSCCIGAAVATLNDSATQRELLLPSEFTAVAAIAVGTAAGETPPASRQPPVILAWR